MPVNANDESVVALTRLIGQLHEGEAPSISRIMAAITAKTYLETITRQLVGDAREEGSTWEEIAVVFGTSAANAKARFGDYHDYD